MDNYVIVIKAGPYTNLSLPFSKANLDVAMTLKYLNNQHNGTFLEEASSKSILIQLVSKENILQEEINKDVPF